MMKKKALSLCALSLVSLLACTNGGTDPSTSSGPVSSISPVAGKPITVNHANYDPSALSNPQIQAAAALKVYFEHASVGRNTCEGINALAAESGSRYVSGRVSWCNADGIDDSGLGTVVPIAPAWFDSHSGLADYHRGNPGAASKLSDFNADLDDTLAGKLDVAMFKFCWIDSPSDGQALFDSVKAVMEAKEAKYPKVAFVWWTMPIERDSADAERQNYNKAVRAYCSANKKWLLDIADLESHDASGAARTDSSQLELQVAAYSSDGGHLNDAGKRKLALAYWRLLAEIAATR